MGDIATQWWLNVADLRPLDVLLTRGSGKFARAILSATSGHFTHAAVSWGEADLLEADGIGTTTTKLDVRLIETVGDKQMDLAILPTTVNDAVVLRHVGASSLDEGRAFKALIAISERFGGTRYSRFGRLAKLVESNQRILKHALRPAAWLVDVIRPVRPSLQGPFCSEVVAAVFEECGLPLFDPPVKADQVTPDKLSSSLLHPQLGIAMTSDEVRAAVGYIPNATKIPWYLFHSPTFVRKYSAWRQRMGRLYPDQ